MRDVSKRKLGKISAILSSRIPFKGSFLKINKYSRFMAFAIMLMGIMQFSVMFGTASFLIVLLFSPFIYSITMYILNFEMSEDIWNPLKKLSIRDFQPKIKRVARPITEKDIVRKAR